MAIAFDAATDGGKVNPATSLTFSHTCTGSLGLLVVGFSGDNFGGADDVSSVTYNSVAMTLAQKITSATGGDRITYIYYLLGPATGAHNVVITCSSSHLIQGGAVSYTGVKASGQPDATTTNFSSTVATTLTTSLTTANDNSWCVLIHGGYDGGSAPTAGAGTTRRTFDGTDGGWGLFDSNGPVTPAGSKSLISNYGSGTNPFGLAIVHVMVSFQPDTGGAATVTYPQLERGTRGLNRGICLGAY
jgi:hypothetical protein